MMAPSPPLPSPSSSSFVRAVIFNSTANAILAFAVKILDLKKSFSSSSSSSSLAHYNSLKVLEWDKLCDSVASFVGTSPGRKATKMRLWSLSETDEESVRLLEETNVAVQTHGNGGFRLDFSGIDDVLVNSAIQHARMDLPIYRKEAIALVALLEFTENLQLPVRAAIKEDSDWYSRFRPLTEAVLEFQANQPLVKLIQRIVEEDGLVKDSANPLLKRTREQVRLLEKKGLLPYEELQARAIYKV